MSIPLAPDDLPFLTVDQMIEVDRLMMVEYRVDLVRMMENAGRCLAQLARTRFLGGDPRGKQVLVLAGTGGNGGGALVCARRLHNYGAVVGLRLTQPAKAYAGVPGDQLTIVRRMGLTAGGVDDDRLPAPDLVIDGLIGYSLHGAPRGRAADLIRMANDNPAPVLSLDVPSGLDGTSGTTYEPAVRADATMTLALPKQGLRLERARAHVGELYVADISVPPELYASSGLNLEVGPVFAFSDVVRLW